MDVTISNLAWMPKAAIGEVNLFLLKKNLTLVPKVTSYGGEEDEAPVVLQMYRETDTHIGVPRAYYFMKKKGANNEIYQVSAGQPLRKNTNVINLRPDDQWPAVQTVLDHYKDKPFAGGIIEAYTAFGKCHPRGTKVVMFDGSLKAVEDVCVGDLLMGPDSAPRTVLSLGGGRGQIFEVRPKKGGKPFRCNLDHVLHLQVTGKNWNKGKDYGSGSKKNISLRDWFSLGVGAKATLKLLRAGAVSLPARSQPYDAYMIGLWIGDGTSRSTAITTADHDELEPYFLDFSKRFALFAERKNNAPRCDCWSFTTPSGARNHYWEFLRDECLHDGEKRIPQNYLLGSIEQRLELLAGLIDSDGHFVSSGNYEITSKFRGLAEQYAFLARSLGFGASVREKTVIIDGVDRVYFRVGVYGVDVIPCKLARKRCQKQEHTNSLLSGFSVVAVGEDDYFGFNLDGDHLYLLEDFTITHNTVAAIKLAELVGRTTIILVHKNPLKTQWMERINQHYPSAKVGFVQGQDCDYEGKDFVIAMAQSIMLEGGDKYPPQLWTSFGLVIVDEIHRFGSRAFCTSAMRFTAKNMLGLSATPYRADGCEDAFKWVIGEIVAKPKQTNQQKPIVYIRETGFEAVRTETANAATGETRVFDMNDFPKPTLLGWISRSKSRNRLIATDIMQSLKANRNPLVMSERLDVLTKVAKLVEGWAEQVLGRKVSSGFYIGGKKKVELDAAAKCDVVYCTLQLAKEGIDIARLDTLFMCTPIADPTQAIGRVGRAATVVGADGEARVVASAKAPMIVDYVDSDLKIFKGIYHSRRKLYNRLGFKIIGKV